MLTQSHFRFGVAELTEQTHGWLAAEDIAIVAEQGSQILCRICLQNDASGAANNIVMQWQCRKLPQGNVAQATAWADINNTNSLILRTGTTTVFTNGQNCTKRLSGTGTFEASAAGCTHDGSAGGAANDIVASGNSESELGVQLLGADLDQGDVIEIRVVGAAGALFGAYTKVPSITVGSVHTIAEVTLQADTNGTRVSPPIPTNSRGYALTIQQVGWAHAGDPALEVLLEVSLDDQQTWIPFGDISVLLDEATPATRITPVNAFRIVASFDRDQVKQNGIKRRLRLSYHAIKTVTVSGTITSLPPDSV